MESQDFEAAAKFIQKYLAIDRSVMDVDSAAHLHSYAQKVKEAVQQKLEEAIKNNNEKDILRYCCLYGPLGMKEEGLLRYAHYLRAVCSSAANSISLKLKLYMGKIQLDLFILQDGNKNPNESLSFVDALTEFFEFVAQLVEEQKEVVAVNFGKEHIFDFIKQVQSQSDVHAMKILTTLADFHQAQELNLLKKKGNVDAQQLKDPRFLVPILDEICYISQVVESFNRFLRTKVKEVSEQDTEKKKYDLPVTDTIKKMGELIGCYIGLEEYFLLETCKKAIRLDQIESQTLVSSVVEHTFLVLQKSIARALISSNENVLCASLNIIVTVLSKDYKEALQKTFTDGLTRVSTSGFLTSATQADASRQKYMIALNNMDASAENTTKLKKEVETDGVAVFGSISIKIKACLDELTETSNTFKKMVAINAENACSSLQNKLKGALDMYPSSTVYELNAPQYAELEVNDPFMQEFVGLIDSVVTPIQPLLTPNNFEQFLAILIRFICQKIESEILKRRVNQYGGLQFDREIKILVNYFSSLTQKAMRDKFARITQIASLLSVEKVAEVFWNQENNWRLSPKEIQKILFLRIDLDKEQISKLKI